MTTNYDCLKNQIEMLRNMLRGATNQKDIESLEMELLVAEEMMSKMLNRGR